MGSILTSFIVRRVDELARLKTALRPLVPYSLDDHSPRGYIEVSRNTAAPGARRALRLGLQRPTLISQVVANVARPVATVAEVVPRLVIELIEEVTRPLGGLGGLAKVLPRRAGSNGSAAHREHHA